MTTAATGPIGRRTALALLLSGIAAPALADAPLSSLRPLVRPGGPGQRVWPTGDAYIEAARLGGDVGYAVADAVTGEVLESVRPLQAHPPASVTKAVTALYALEKLGAQHRFRTRIMATGHLEAGELKGDIILVGGGDPLLDSDNLFDLAGRLKLAGINAVNGKLLVYAGALPQITHIDERQPIQVGYNPGVSGLNLNFNRVFLEWKRAGSGYDVTMEARALRVRPSVAFASTQIVDRSGPVFTYDRSPRRESWTVARSALGNGGGRWLPVRAPGTYVGEVFQSLARSHGIALNGPEQIDRLPADLSLIAEHLSPPLEEICRGMLKFSTNLTAEAIGLAASQAGTLRGSGAAMSTWMGSQFGTKAARFVDHSGLGDRTKVSPVEMVQALTGQSAQAVLSPLLKEVALLDENGDLAKDGRINVVAKTGTLNFVSGLAGYVRTPGGRDLAFAIFASDLPRRAALSQQERERPRGARSWNGRAKRLQHQLINRWAAVHEAEANSAL